MGCAIGERSNVANSEFSERVALFRARGGKLATAFWLMRHLGRLDVYAFYVVALNRFAAVQRTAEACEFISLSDLSGIAGHDATIIKALDEHSGCGVAETIRRGGRIYALVRGQDVLSQLKIDLEESAIDTPADVRITVGKGNAFLSFLFTAEAARRAGWARVLVDMTCAALAAEGLRHCVCHVQATNLRSGNTFDRLGWSVAGWLLASSAGRFLGIVRNRFAQIDGLDIHAHPPAPRLTAH